MNRLVNITFTQVCIRLLFLVLPTCVLAWFAVQHVSESFTALDTGASQLALYFCCGLTVSYVLYLYRVRFSVTFVLLLLAIWLINKYIDHLPGEFDVFYASVRFWLFRMFFITGWIMGFMLAKTRFASIIIAITVLFYTLSSYADDRMISATFLLKAILPPLAYALYMIFVGSVLADSTDLNVKKALKLSARLAIFLLFVGSIFWGVNKYFEAETRAVEDVLTQGQSPDSTGEGGGPNNSMLEKQADGTQSVTDSASMDQNGGGGGGDPLMFCARLNSYFPNGQPKPMYFTFHHLTKYDQQTETFTRDPLMPEKDEFMPDPTTIPLYQIKSDPALLSHLKTQKKRTVVTADVYMSDKTWAHSILAPSTAYSCQSIPVDREFKKTFVSGYRVRSYASELLTTYSLEKKNTKPYLASAQREAISELMDVENYDGVDAAFLNYYLKNPSGPLYDSISALAKRLTANAKTPMEKVAIIHDYFMSKDEEGKPLFKYSLKAGKPDDPNIPTGTMLGEFLFHSHKGYCTFFAGATVLMLRSVGVPARFTVGFCTIDRSDKNKGWYWFYAHQAHAWTQVYFPEYGWLDFDTTIGNDDMEESPQPDGTPPLPPPPPFIVLNGIVAKTPTTPFAQLEVRYDAGVLLDQEVRLDASTTHQFSSGPATLVTLNDKDTTLQAAHEGDSVVIVSYRTDLNADAEEITPEKAKQQLEQLANPFPADEIHIRVKVPDEKKEDKQKTPEQKDGKSDWSMLWWSLGILGVFLILNVCLLPLHIYFFLRMRVGRARGLADKADRIYKLVLYFLHQTAHERGNETVTHYAATKIDPVYAIQLTEFMHLVQRLKYSGLPATAADEQLIQTFYPQCIERVRAKHGVFKMLMRLLHPARAHRYFRRPADAHLPEQESPKTPASTS